MKIKTSMLEGRALDWAVAKCVHPESRDEFDDMDVAGGLNMDEGRPFSPSTDWATGGPIIDRENIATFPACEVSGMFWAATIDKGGSQAMELYDLDNRAAWWFEEREVTRGPTALVAAMRCYVASKLGQEIEVPEAFA